MRFSRSDAAIIIVFAGATWAAYYAVGNFALVIPVALGHFFLFCNIFRISRRLEYVWSALLIVNVMLWVSFSEFDWSKILAAQSPVTIVVISMEVKSTRYHGVFSRAKRSRNVDTSIEVEEILK